MKAKLLFLTMLLPLSACSLIWSPTATVKKFMAAAQKGDVETMTQLFSNKAIQKLGFDQIKSNNQRFAETAQRTTAAGGSYRMENVLETAIPEGKRVSFVYKNGAGTDSIKLVFNLSKEGSAWKIDNLGGSELEESTDVQTPGQAVPELQEPGAPQPQPLSEKSETETKAATSSETISGGVLNGKAISLPKPAYPPIARQVKASGTVVVQVLVDENGRVVSAQAISGHPLLQAAAVVAARGAKFPRPTLGGQFVKLAGVINYHFEPQ